MLREDFACFLAYLGSAVGKSIGGEQAEVYYDLLNDLPLAALQIAAKRALLESRYPTLPPIGTLRALALEAMKPARQSPEEAWETVRKALARYGYCREIEGLDSLPEDARRAAECLGWQTLCDSTEPEVCRAQFRKAYESLAERKQRVELLPTAMRETIAQLSRGFVYPALADVGDAS